MKNHDIRHSLLFENVDKQYVEEFLASLPKLSYKKGGYLWRQGDSGNSMYLLEKGKLEVVLEMKDRREEVIAIIESGAVIGELCVFGQKKRTAGIRASEDSQVYEVDGEVFRQRVKDKEMDVLLISFNIAKLLSDRLTAASDFIRKLQEIPEKSPSIKSELERYRARFSHESLFN